MNKKIIYCLPIALIIFGFSIKTLLPKKDTLLNHIALHVNDLQKSSKFYEEVLQLDSVPEPFHDGRHTWLKIGNVSALHLISGSANKYVPDKNSHLCFTVPSITDFIARMEVAHVEYENWAGAKGTVTTRVDGIKQIYFQDPDGYWVEINNDYK